jgi:uncharacterized protein YjbJ (UPF0337 family)
MIPFKQLRRFFYYMSLTTILIITITFSFGTQESWATMPINQLINRPQPQIAMFNRAKAMSKDIEGKTQEAIGNLTGDPKNQMMGKAKQVESQALSAAENLKDKTQLAGRTKAVAKNLEGKVQETKGNITGDRQDQAMGKTKQVESQARNVVEDMKEGVRGIFN